MRSATLFAGLSLVLSSLSPVEGHITMWNKGLFGWNWPNQATDAEQQYNNNIPVVPLRGFDNLTQSQWFAHALLDYPPAPGDFMTLPAGGSYTAELACNRAFTTMRDPRRNGENYPTYACPEIGPLHTANKFGQKPDNKWLGGTALGIAYTSDERSVQPNDFTIISVNYTSVWYRTVVYQIPKNLPVCPEGGCLCTWNWYHMSGHGEGYGNEFYNTLYRCNITGQTSEEWVIPLGSGQSPMLCPTGQMCNKGPKMPMYTYLVSGMNIDPPPASAPSYNQRYGFTDGAQNDIFVNLANETKSTPSTNGSGSNSSDGLDPFRKSGSPIVISISTLSPLAGLALAALASLS